MATQDKGTTENTSTRQAAREKAQADAAAAQAEQDSVDNTPSHAMLPVGDPGRLDEAPDGGRFWVNGVLVDSEGKSDAEREADAKALEAKVKADQQAAEERAHAQDQADRDRAKAQEQANEDARARREEALKNRPKPTPPPVAPSQP